MGQTFGRIAAEIVRRVSSALVLPFDTSVFGTELERYMEKFSTTFNVKLAAMNITLTDLASAVESFKKETKMFDQRLQLFDRNQYFFVSSSITYLILI